MVPPDYHLERTRENYIENIRYYCQDSVELDNIITDILEHTPFLENKEFAVSLVDACPELYYFEYLENWQDNRDVALKAVQKDVNNLDMVPDDLKDDTFYIEAFAPSASNLSRLNDTVPEWRNNPTLASRVVALNPHYLTHLSRHLYQVNTLDVIYPTWRTDVHFIIHALTINASLLNDVDPSMYKKKQLMLHVMQLKIPLRLLNKRTPEQQEFKEKIRSILHYETAQKHTSKLGKSYNVPIGWVVNHKVKGFLGRGTRKNRKNKIIIK